MAEDWMTYVTTREPDPRFAPGGRCTGTGRRIAGTVAAWLLAASCLLAGCAAYPPRGVGIEPDSIAVVGVGRLHGVAEGLNGSVAGLDLAARLRDAGRRGVLEPSDVRAALGRDSWSALMARDATGGSLDARDIRLLAGAGLGTRLALIVRVDRDEITRSGPERESVRDAAGRVLRDRVRVRYTTRRQMMLSAELVDLAVPGSLWRRTFAADPTTRQQSIRYRGSSFSGSVAARLANTVVNGPGGIGPPPPARQRETLESLFDEIELAVPVRAGRR